MRAEAGQPTVVTAAFVNDSGELVDPGPVGELEVQVLDGAGNPQDPVVPTVDAEFRMAVTLAPRDELDTLTVTFHAADGRRVRVHVDVVDQRLVPLDELAEAVRQQAPALYGEDGPVPQTGAASYLRKAADAAQDWLEDAGRFPVGRRGVRARFLFRGGPTLEVPGVLKPGDLYEATIGGSVQDVADVVAVDRRGWAREPAGVGMSYLHGGSAVSPALWPAGIARVWGTHGLERPGEHVRRAGLVLARYLMRTTRVPERAMMMTTESTQIIFSKPDRDRPTGLPEVDSVAVSLRQEAETPL